MGFLLDDKAPDKINGQRDVVKNEKRQSVDNQPYGQAFDRAGGAALPAGHPYSWSTIGSMEDLIRGQLRRRGALLPHLLRAVERQPRDRRRHRHRRRPASWSRSGSAMCRRASRCRRLTPPTRGARRRQEARPSPIACSCRASTWRGTPRRCSSPATRRWTSSSNLLSRRQEFAALSSRLVYDLQIAQDVTAFQQSQALGSNFLIMATARPGQIARQDPGGDRRGARQAARNRTAEPRAR